MERSENVWNVAERNNNTIYRGSGRRQLNDEDTRFYRVFSEEIREESVRAVETTANAETRK